MGARASGRGQGSRATWILYDFGFRTAPGAQPAPSTADPPRRLSAPLGAAPESVIARGALSVIKQDLDHNRILGSGLLIRPHYHSRYTTEKHDHRRAPRKTHRQIGRASCRGRVS